MKNCWEQVRAQLNPVISPIPPFPSGSLPNPEEYIEAIYSTSNTGGKKTSGILKRTNPYFQFPWGGGTVESLE